MWTACEEGDGETVIRLLEEGKSVNCVDGIGNTPIIWALYNSRSDAGKLLVEKGANLFKKDDYGKSAMDRRLGPQVLQHAKDLI
jgi:ankyrin repeat protein